MIVLDLLLKTRTTEVALPSVYDPISCYMRLPIMENFFLDTRYAM